MFGTLNQIVNQMDNDVGQMESATEETNYEDNPGEASNFDEDDFDNESRPQKSNKKKFLVAGIIGVVLIFGCGLAAAAFLVDWRGVFGASNTHTAGFPGAPSSSRSSKGRSAEGSAPKSQGGPPAFRHHKLDDASCEDFYDFACNALPLVDKNELVVDNRDVSFSPLRIFLDIYRSLLEDTPRPNELPSTKLIREMLRTCTDKEGVEAKGTLPLKAVVKQLGGWPLMEGSTWAGNRDMTMILMGNISRFWGNNGLVDVRVGVKSNRRHPTIQVSPVNVERFTTYYPRKPPVPVLDSDDYIFSIVYVAHALSQRPDNFAAVKTAAQNLAELENNLRKIMPPEKLHEVAEMSIRDLSDYTKMNWLPFFQAVFQDIKYVTNDERIEVSDKQLLRNIFRLLNDLPDTETALANFIMWKFMQDLIWHTSSEMQTLSDKLRGIPAEDIPTTFRAMRCVDYTMMFLPYAVTRHYVDNFIHEKDIRAIEDVAVNVKNYFIAQVNKGSWLSSASRRALRKKIEDVRLKIGYPKWVMINDLLQEFYSGLKIGSNHLENILNAAEIRMKNKLMKIRGESKFDMWIYSPLRANAVFAIEENTIFLCLGIIRSLGFSKDTPLPARYAGIGSVIAHEFAHNLFGASTFFDADSSQGIVIYPEDRPVFEERTLCLVRQYSNFCPDLATRRCVNGNTTLAENYADNVGLSMAYKAFLKHWGGQKLPRPTTMRGFDKYSPEQLFFVNFASMHCLPESPQLKLMFARSDFHSPPEFRVNGPVSNMAEFSSVYVCSADALMNRRDERCSLW